MNLIKQGWEMHSTQDLGAYCAFEFVVAHKFYTGRFYYVKFKLICYICLEQHLNDEYGYLQISVCNH